MNMTNVILKKISENQNLIKFCNKILSYNAIFLDEFARNMFLTSLISADNLIDEHACDDTIETAEFILIHIDLFILEDDIKKNIISHLNDAINIAKRDKKDFYFKKIENIINNG